MLLSDTRKPKICWLCCDILFVQSRQTIHHNSSQSQNNPICKMVYSCSANSIQSTSTPITCRLLLLLVASAALIAPHLDHVQPLILHRLLPHKHTASSTSSPFQRETISVLSFKLHLSVVVVLLLPPLNPTTTGPTTTTINKLHKSFLVVILLLLLFLERTSSSSIHASSHLSPTR